MQGNGWKLAVAFIIGAVLSFLAGMYILGPLFVPHKGNDGGTEAISPSTSTATSLPESIPNGVYRRDVDSVPDHTAVIVERIQRPIETAPETSPSPSQESYVPPTEQIVPPQKTPSQQPPVSSSPEKSGSGVEEPISPPSETKLPQPPTSTPPTQPPPPPEAKTKKAYRVRIGVFSQEENVKRWLETLSELGYYPYTEEEVSGGKRRYRVYVGAFDNRESAERLRQELRDKGIQSVIEEKSE